MPGRSRNKAAAATSAAAKAAMARVISRDLGEARGEAAADFGGGVRGVVGRRIAPALDRAGERPGDAGVAQRAVEPVEFLRAAIEIDDVHRLAAGGGLADHRYGIGGHQ